MAKKIAQDAERRAMAAKVLAERKRTERRRSALILGACIVVVVGLLAAALIPYFKDKQDAEVVGTAIEKLGVTETAAHCDPVTEKSADGSGRKCCRSDVQAWGSSRKQTCVSDADALAQTAGHSAASDSSQPPAVNGRLQRPSLPAGQICAGVRLIQKCRRGLHDQLDAHAVHAT